MMTNEDPTPEPEEPAEPTLPALSRRAVLVGVGAASVAILGGCATYGSGNNAAGSGGGGDDPGDTGDDTGSEKPLQTTDVPVGGGVIVDERNVVVTQPKAGEFKAFTAVCTHQGCTVAEVKDGTINCPCHGSKFKVADGSVAQGPAQRALRAVAITVSGTNITFS
jgi:Rieske Fe-S protein